MARKKTRPKQWRVPVYMKIDGDIHKSMRIFAARKGTVAWLCYEEAAKRFLTEMGMPPVQ